jgi:hypothetical protein
VKFFNCGFGEGDAENQLGTIVGKIKNYYEESMGIEDEVRLLGLVTFWVGVEEVPSKSLC